MAKHYEFSMMTWGHLKTVLANVSDDAVVVIDDNDGKGGGWFNYIGELIVPDYDVDGGDEDGYIAITLMQGRPLDPREVW